MDYLLSDGHASADGLFYGLGFHIAWDQSGQVSSTGSFTADDGTAFNVDISLADQAVSAGGFASGWDGKSLTKADNGLLVLSAPNIYTGSLTVEVGMRQQQLYTSLH